MAIGPVPTVAEVAAARVPEEVKVYMLRVAPALERARR
jgi:hypothetical protein